ncbi:MAG: hypothetical protein AB1391_02110 [Candidatus Micrarchaeota archaeon]
MYPSSGGGAGYYVEAKVNENNGTYLVADVFIEPNSVFISDGVIIRGGAYIKSKHRYPTFIGGNVVIGKNVIVYGDNIISPNIKIGENSIIFEDGIVLGSNIKENKFVVYDNRQSILKTLDISNDPAKARCVILSELSRQLPDEISKKTFEIVRTIQKSIMIKTKDRMKKPNRV